MREFSVRLELTDLGNLPTYNTFEFLKRDVAAAEVAETEEDFDAAVVNNYADSADKNKYGSKSSGLASFFGKGSSSGTSKSGSKHSKSSSGKKHSGS